MSFQKSNGLSMLYTAFLIWVVVPRVFAVYDPSNPPKHPNLDPAEANPEYNITCRGPLPPYFFPLFPDWDPNTATLQEVCASEQYGGKARSSGGIGRTANAICIPDAAGSNRPSAGAIAIDVGSRSGVDDDESLASYRLYIYCKLRCWCEHGNEGVSNKPRTILERPYSVRRENFVYDTVRVDSLNVYDRQRGDGEESFDHYSFDERPVVSVKVVDQSISQQGGRPIREGGFNYVAMSPENQIICDDIDIARPFAAPIPPPYTLADFESLQEICSVEWSGGHPYANAGGYCQRMDADGDILSSGNVWFSDEFTPRLEWAWSRGLNVLRYHCLVHCKCELRPSKKKLAYIDFLIESRAMAANPRAVKRGRDGSGGGDTGIEGPTNKPAKLWCGGSQQCSTIDSYGVTADPWPAFSFNTKSNVNPAALARIRARRQRKVPFSISSSTQGASGVDPVGVPFDLSHSRVRLPSSGTPLGENLQCGATCNGPAAAQCSGASSTIGCECVTIASSIAHYLGLPASGDTVSRCLQVVALHSILQKMQQSKLSTAGTGRRRSVDSNVEYPSTLDLNIDSDKPWSCACNATTSHVDCCTTNLAQYGL